MLLSLIEKLRKRETVLKESGSKTYRDLVRTVADGASVPEDKAADTCERAGKSADDLERDVTRLVERRRLFDSFRGSAAAEQELQTARGELAAEVERFKAIEAKHAGMVQTINARIAAATAKFSGAESARQALIDGVTDPALFAERDGLLSRLREIEGEQAEVHQRIASLDHVIGVNQRDDDGTDGIVAEQVQSRRDARERLRELSTEAEAVNARLVTFDRERMTSPDA